MSSFKEFFSKKINLINSVLLYALAVFGALNIVFWNIPIVDKVAISGGAAILTIMFIVNIKHYKSWQFYLMLFNILSLMVTLTLNKGRGLGVVLTAFCLIISIILFNTVTFDRKAINICRYIIGVAIIILFATSKYRKSHDGNWIHISDRISEKSVNNNSLCILIVVIVFFAVLLLKNYYESKKKGSLILVGIITVMGIAFALPFGGRMAIASMALFFILLMLRNVKIKTSLYRYLCIMIFLLALIIPILYIQLHNAVGNFSFMGKDFFSGRQRIWKEAFEQILQYPIFGSGTALDFVDFSTQSAHNTMLGIWKNVGILPLITVIICFFRRRYEYINLEDRAILALLIIMFTESFFMDSHFCFIFLAFMLRSHDQVETDIPQTRFERWINQKVLNKRKVKNDT